MKLGLWYVSSDGERYDEGGYATREEAIAYAEALLDLSPGDNFWTGQSCDPNEETPDGCDFGITDAERHTASETAP